MSELIPLDDSLTSQQLLSDIRHLIEIVKTRVARSINSEMTLLYWRIGKTIKEQLLKNQRAEYGDKLIIELGRHLSAEYGQGYERSNLLRMVQFYECFSDNKIVATLSRQLTWSHIKLLLPIKNKVEQEFYAAMSAQERWSVRQLSSNINKMLFDRTMVSRKPDIEVTKSLKILETADPFITDLVLKDPYLLDFLCLPKDHKEADLEDAILREIQEFILELGTGFSFVARQKRLTIDEDHFYLDLLFFNRKLKRLVAVELKSGRFKPEYLGQMQLYLGWLQKYECLEGELPPIGIILCTEKSQHQIELLEPSASGIHIAEYWTELPPKDVFERKIQQIVKAAKERLAVEKQKLIKEA